MTTPRVCFQPGNIGITLGAHEIIGESHHLLAELLRRHTSGDWGDVGKEDAEANNRAVTFGERILSSYRVKGERLWIVTESDRSATTVLTPGEY